MLPCALFNRNKPIGFVIADVSVKYSFSFFFNEDILNLDCTNVDTPHMYPAVEMRCKVEQGKT